MTGRGHLPTTWWRRRKRRTAAPALALLATLAFAVSCAPRPPRPPETVPVAVERGVASWYGGKFHGRFTASGERYDMDKLTAAHPRLPFDTLVEVRNLDNDRRVEVRINDRGPFVHGRVIDVSREAARRLEMIGAGTARVELRVLPGRRFVAQPVLASLRSDVSDSDGGPARGDPRWAVQLGAFQFEEGAESLKEELAARFPTSRIERDGPWYRVLVGRFGSRERAQGLRDELARLGFPAILRATP